MARAEDSQCTAGDERCPASSHLQLFALESVQWLIFLNILFLSKTLSNTLFRGVNCFNILLLYYSE